MNIKNPDQAPAQPNPQADKWASLTNGAAPARGKYVMGPEGNMVPEQDYDAAMEAYERKKYYEEHPEAKDLEALRARLEEMDKNPDRLANFEGEHVRGASDRDSEYMTLHTGENGMYEAAPDGTPLNNDARKEMARKMHDAEDLQTFEENERYRDYIAREREKIGITYESVDDFNHKVVARLKRLQQSKENTNLEDEERKRLEEEERKRLEAEERERHEAEERRRQELEAELAEVDEELGHLVAINADFTHDKKELAHDLAEKELNADNAKAGLIKRIWRGTFFKKYYQKKYEHEILEGSHTFGKDEKGKDITIDVLIKKRSKDAIQRFVLGATEDMRFIHDPAGEKLVPADEATSSAVQSAIEKFATAKITEGVSFEDLRREFSNDIKRIGAEKRDQGQSIDEKLINNYFEVAMQARERFEHGIAMEKVMEGFRVYNAEVRDGIRTEAHRDNIDKIINKLESSKIGQFIPAEVIAGAVGCAWALTQSGARALAGAGAGLGVSGVFAGLRERNRVTEDRTRMIRDLANSEFYDGNLTRQPKGKREKYEAKIGGTVYDFASANNLTAKINQATESGNSEDLLRAIAEARVRIDFSDSEQKDLIAYSSADKRGDERMRLDVAVIRAEKALSDTDKSKLDLIKKEILKSITDSVDEKDKNFRKVRTALAIKQAGKTIAIGALSFLASQEVMAAFDPSKIGLLEKIGIIPAKNNLDADETLLASGFGLARGKYERVITRFEDVSVEDSYEVDRITLEEGDPHIAELQADGYVSTKVANSRIAPGREVVNVAPANSPSRLDVVYDGWANNGTNVSDGNELRLFLSNGQFRSGMSGTSTMGNQVFDYNTLAASGRIKGFVTVGGAKFEIASSVNSSGQLIWGNNGILTTTSGETLKVIGDNGEKLYQYFEIALDNGIDASGATHIIPFATDVGANTFSDTIRHVIDVPVEHPALYELVKTNTIKYPRLFTGGVPTEFTRNIFTNGIIVPIPASRTGLGEARPAGVPSRQAPPEPTPAPARTPEPAPAPASEPAPAPSSPEQTPPGEPAPSPEAYTAEQKARYRAIIENGMGNLIGDTGVNLLTSEEEPENEDPELIASWWENLSDDGKNTVIAVATSPTNLGLGRGLRQWLRDNELIPQ